MIASSPGTLTELCDMVRGSQRVRIGREESFLSRFRLPEPHERGDEAVIDLRAFRKIVEHDVDDQVVKVQGGIPLAELNAELEKTGQCIPMFPWATSGDSVGSLVGMNLPHARQAQCGSWRDWVLGMTVVLADGTVAKCGSKAVKNVAGYDVQKLLVGARDTLGVIFDLTLRTFPIRALPESNLEIRLPEGDAGACWWLQRVAPSNWAAALDLSTDVAMADHASHTLYAIVSADRERGRFPGDWVLRSGCGAKNLRIDDPIQVRLMRRAKEIFDPTHKLNPGEMGIF